MTATVAAHMQLAPDPALPQRDLLLDAQAVAQRLTMLGARAFATAATIEQCERTRTKYRIGASLRVLYRLHIGGAPYALTARTFRDGASLGAYRKASENAVACGALQPLIHDAELDTVFWAFPNDRKIARLALLAGDPGPLAALLGGGWTTSRLVSYAPERAATAQCLDAAGGVLAYAKMYGGEEGRRSYAMHQSLARGLSLDDALCVPRALAFSEADKTLLLEPIVGRHAADLPDIELEAAAKGFGAALAQLHSLPIPAGIARFYHLDLSALETAARVLSQLRPELGEPAAKLTSALQTSCAAPTSADVCLHGDVSFKNWLVTSEAVVLIDLDAVSTGPAAADLGGAVSDLIFLRRIGGLSAAATGRLIRGLIDGYATRRVPPSLRELRWHTAAALLAQRALHAVTRVRSEWLPHLSSVLADAIEILADTGGDLA